MGKLIADRAYQRLLDLVASIDFRARAGPPARRPRSCCSVRPLALIVWDLNRRDVGGTVESAPLRKWSALRAIVIDLRIV
jgi:hypothetical protein